MYKNGTLILLHAQSSLHAGSGNAENYIDLPIQRESHTGHPYIEGSGVKGAYRSAVVDYLVFPKEKSIAEAQEFKGKSIEEAQEFIKTEFGTFDTGDSSAALGFSDASLLFFPVKSMKGTMAWITCPRVLHLFKQRNILIGWENNFTKDIPQFSLANNQIDAPNSLVFSNRNNKNKVILEEYLFEQKNEETTNAYFAEIATLLFGNDSKSYWRKYFLDRVAVVNDNVFQLFVELHTEVVTRNKINPNTGVADDGQLFVEEYLPPESILYCTVWASPEFKDKGGKPADKILNNFCSCMQSIPYLQIGGDATVGSGICKNILPFSTATTTQVNSQENPQDIK